MLKSNFLERFISMQSDGVSKDISGRDLNEILTTGSYEGIGCINAPISGFIKLIVTHHTDSWVVQECEISNGDIYLRAYQNGKWYEWQMLDLSDDNDGEGVGITIQVVDRPHTHDIATAQTKGFMSNIDKIKLDTIDDRANNYVHPLTHSADMIRETDDKKFVTQDMINKINSIQNVINTVSELQQKILILESTNNNLSQAIVDLTSRVNALEGNTIQDMNEEQPSETETK